MFQMQLQELQVITVTSGINASSSHSHISLQQMGMVCKTISEIYSKRKQASDVALKAV